MLYPNFLYTKKKCLTVLRRTAGSYDDNGRYVEGTETPIKVEANVQPASKWGDVQRLPEGERSRPMLVMYTADVIRIRQEGENGWDGDLLEWIDGQTYEAFDLRQYRMGTLNHDKVLLVRVERT